MTEARRLRRDTAVNVVFAVVRTVALMWVISLAATRFTPAALGVFLLSRRIASTFACLLQLGVSQTLMKHLAGEPEPAVRRSVTAFALITWIAVGLGLAIVTTVAQGPLATLMFPADPDAQELTRVTAFLVVGTIASYLPYSVLLAERRVALANLVELANASGFLLGALIFLGDASPPEVLTAQTAAMIITSVGICLVYMRRIWPSPVRLAHWHDYLRFGLPRGFSAFLDMLVLLVGPWLLRESPEEAAALIIALTLVRAIQSAVMPLSQIGAIVTAQLRSPDGDHRIRTGTRLLVAAVLYCSTLSLAILLPWSTHLLGLWLPDERLAEGVGHYLMILSWGVVPYMVFQALKGIIDMRWLSPLNLVGLTIASVVQVVVAWALQSTVGSGPAAALGITASFLMLGVSTLVWLRADLTPLSDFGLAQLVGLSGILAAVNVWLARGDSVLHLLTAGLLSLVAVALYLALSPSPLVRSARAFMISPDRS